MARQMTLAGDLRTQLQLLGGLMTAELVASCSAADSTGTGTGMDATAFVMFVALLPWEEEGEAWNVASPRSPVTVTKEASYPSHDQQVVFSEPPRSLVRRLARVASGCLAV